MNIILLTHERELAKRTNTGNIVLDSLGERATRITWQRTEPSATLLDLIERQSIALLYPSDETESDISDFEHFVILDGTWQQSRKMINRSAYLQSMPKVSLRTARTSNFALRRNQVEGGLCTAECAIELLKAKREFVLGASLEERYTEFNIRSNESKKP